METSLVTTKGQIVIPSKLRQRFHIKKGTKICFIEKDGEIMLRPLTESYIDGLRGSMQTDGAALRKVASQED